MDIHCKKCGEPWNSYGVRNGDMTPVEAKKFLRGDGCPTCHFGQNCPACNGTGYQDGTGILRARIDGTPKCSACNGTGRVDSEEHSKSFFMDLLDNLE